VQKAVLPGETFVEGRFDVHFAGTNMDDLPIEGIDQSLVHKTGADALLDIEGESLLMVHDSLKGSRMSQS
jgi:hypothetical protein